MWHSLNGPRRALGEVTSHAARFDPDVSVFSALDDEAGTEAWDELRSLVGPGAAVTLVRPDVVVPAAWTLTFRSSGVQLLADVLVDPVCTERFVALGVAEVPEMLELIAETKPGPFFPRTVEFGGYMGFRDGGRLVAMAGERLKCPGFTEISAVCTLPSHRGRGLGTALVLSLAQSIRARGEHPFLQVASGNVNAIRLYLALGFTLRRDDIDAIGVTSPA